MDRDDGRSDPPVEVTGCISELKHTSIPASEGARTSQKAAVSSDTSTTSTGRKRLGLSSRETCSEAARSLSVSTIQTKAAVRRHASESTTTNRAPYFDVGIDVILD
jgi:hypothetical protein